MNFVYRYLCQGVICALVILGIWLAIRFAKFYRNVLRQRASMDKIPGLKARPIIGNLPVTLNGGIYSKNITVPITVVTSIIINGAVDLFKEKGLYTFWFFWKPYVHLYKASTVEALLSSNVEIEKSREYHFMKPWLGTGLLTSTGSKWRKQRKMLTPTFNFRILDQFQPVIEKHSRTLVKNIGNTLDDGHVSILPLITYCTLDIIFETALGITTSAQIDRESPFMLALNHVTQLVIHRFWRPWLWNDFIFNISPSGRFYKKALKEIHLHSEMAIRERKEEMLKSGPIFRNDEFGVKKCKAFLDLLLEEHFKDDSFTELDIRHQVDTFAFAGHDTTTTGASWCLYLLGLHPEAQEKIFLELQGILGTNPDTEIMAEHLKAMKYLECVMKESQRLYPSVPTILRTLKEDMKIGEFNVPSGATCVVNVAMLHRDEDVFPESDKFIPERFELEQSTGRHPYAYVPFSAGPRNCIGQRFATNEVKTIVANLVRNFTWKSLRQRDKVLVSMEVVGRPYPGHYLKFYKRGL